MKSILPACLLLLAIAGCNIKKVDDAVYCVQVDPLEKVFILKWKYLII